ncbi:ATP-binding response regulator [Magnetospira thiophila]
MSVATKLNLIFIAAFLFCMLAAGIGIASFMKFGRSMVSFSERHVPTATAGLILSHHTGQLVARVSELIAAETQSERMNAFNAVEDQHRAIRLQVEKLIADPHVRKIEQYAKDLFNDLSAINADMKLLIDQGHAVEALRAEVFDLHSGLMAHSVTPEPDLMAAVDKLLRMFHARNIFTLERLGAAYEVAWQKYLAGLSTEAGGAPPAGVAWVPEYAGKIFERTRQHLDLHRKVEGRTESARLAAQRLSFQANILYSQARDRVAKAISETHATIQRSSLILASLSVVSLSALLLLGLLISRTIARRLKTLEESMRVHASGGRTNIPIQGADEISSMAQALKVFIETIDQRESQLREARAQAESADRDKSRFLAAASHDLRQPLQALTLYLGTLDSLVGERTAHEIIGRAKGSVEALSGLLDTLLDISKLDAGLIAPSIRPFAAADVLYRMEAEFQPLARHKGLDLRFVSSSLALRSDPVLLARILRNLISNALKYTYHGRVLVGVRRRAGQAEFQVCDSGEGIAAADQGAIFREFFQVGNAERNRREGLGLGLAIVSRLSQLLEHPVRVVSELGRGSVFSLSVPLVMGPVPIVTKSDPMQLQTALDVLVIDDEPEIRAALAGLMQSWGWRVRLASSGAEAQAQVHGGEWEPDVILSDFRLSGGENGTETIARMRQILGRDVPALLLTGDTGLARLREAKSSRLPLLHKPVTAENLWRAVTEVLLPGEPA